jgi:hypothetical protein
MKSKIKSIRMNLNPANILHLFEWRGFFYFQRGNISFDIVYFVLLELATQISSEGGFEATYTILVYIIDMLNTKNN